MRLKPEERKYRWLKFKIQNLKFKSQKCKLKLKSKAKNFDFCPPAGGLTFNLKNVFVC